MRVLAVSSLFPNAARPLSAPFNRQQLAALSRLCDVRMLAPILTFPGAQFFRGRISGVESGNVPERDVIDGLEVTHPRALYAPGLQGYVGVPLYFASLLKHVAPLRGKVDVVFCAWAHPDGCAGPAIARLLNVPLVVKVQGSDIDLYSHLRPHKYWLRTMLPLAHRVVAVSRALARDVAKLGVPQDKVRVVYNGVDPRVFHPRDRLQARDQLGIAASDRVVLFVGNVIRDKGAVELKEAFLRLLHQVPNALLVVVGKGDRLDSFKGVNDRIRALGARPFDEIPTWMAASDVVTLPSYHEGTPNVVIEALKCGRRVVATDVGGIPDLITEPKLGELVPPRDTAALEAALVRALSTDYDANEVERLGGRGDWQQSAIALLSVLREVTQRS